MVDCPVCHGIGTLDYNEEGLHQVECWFCKGKGCIEDDRQNETNKRTDTSLNGRVDFDN